MSGWRFVGLFAYYVLLSALAVLSLPPSPRRHTGSGPLRLASVDGPFSCSLRCSLSSKGMRPEAIRRAAFRQVTTTAERLASRGHAFLERDRYIAAR